MKKRGKKVLTPAQTIEKIDSILGDIKPFGHERALGLIFFSPAKVVGAEWVNGALVIDWEIINNSRDLWMESMIVPPLSNYYFPYAKEINSIDTIPNNINTLWLIAAYEALENMIKYNPDCLYAQKVPSIIKDLDHKFFSLSHRQEND